MRVCLLVRLSESRIWYKLSFSRFLLRYFSYRGTKTDVFFVPWLILVLGKKLIDFQEYNSAWNIAASLRNDAREKNESNCYRTVLVSLASSSRM